MRVFISHCSEDKLWFRGLAAGFERSGVTVWDYREDGRTTAGRRLALEFEELVTSDLCVVVLSCRSLKNPHVAREAACAAGRWRANERRLFVVTLPGAPLQARWPTPFARLADIIALPAATPARVDDLTAEILGSLAVEYVARAGDPARLPLLRRTMEELAELEDAGRRALATCAQAPFNALIRTIEGVARGFKDRRYDEAAAGLAHARLLLATIAPASPPYYLGIAAAVCALLGGRVDAAADALAAVAHHPAIDESWHGASAAVAVARGQWRAAHAAAVEALRISRARQSGDFEAAVLLRGIELELKIAGESVPAGETLDRVEFVTVATVEAMTQLESGHPDRAVAAFDGVTASEHDDASIGVYAKALEANGDAEEAARTLRVHLSRAPGAEGPLTAQRAMLWRLYARNHLVRARLCDAIAVYRDVLCPPAMEAHPAVLTEYARLLLLAGRLADERAVCERALGRAPRSTTEDYYCLGLAAYLLGRVELAERMLEWAHGYGPAYTELLAADQRDACRGTAACRAGTCACDHKEIPVGRCPAM